MSVSAKDVLNRAASLVADDLQVAHPEEAAAAVARVLRLASEPAAYVSGSRLAELLGTSRQAVQQRAARGRLLVQADGSGVRYPLWQLHDGEPFEELPKLIAAAHSRGVSDVALIAWLEAQPSRIEALCDGHVTELIDALPSGRVQVRRHRRSSKPAPSLHD